MGWDFDEIIEREGTSCVKYDLRNDVFGDGSVIPMWVADMDFRTPDFIIRALQKRLDHGIMGYTFRPPEFYGSIVQWMLKRHNWRIESEWVTFSPGIVPALNLCTLAFTRPGDSIIIQPPVYPPFFTAVENHGRELVLNQLTEQDGRWLMDPGSLKKAVKPNTRMIIISNPHNPVGRAWTRGELLELAGICLENNIIILSDEIHCDLMLPGSVHTPVASLSPEIADITVTCIAPSKTFNLAGLATSAVVISNPVLRKYFDTKTGHLHIHHGNIFGTVASVAAYTEGEEWLESLLKYISENVETLCNYLTEKIPLIKPVIPEATYMIWLDCRKLGLPGKELKDFFRGKAGVGLNEGQAFGPGGEGFMRMNLATQKDIVLKALEQIEKAVNTYRKLG